MTTEQAWLVGAGAVALVALVLALLGARRARHAEAVATSLAERVAFLESLATDTPRPPADDVVAGAGTGTYVITGLTDDRPERHEPAEVVAVAAPIDGRLFADIVARETVVKAASWTAGIRRALSPESRSRIRFQVRQETKRAGRERRAEAKQALREFRARERAGGSRRAEVGEDVA